MAFVEQTGLDELAVVQLCRPGRETAGEEEVDDLGGIGRGVVDQAGPAQLDDGEFIETCLLDERHLDAMASRGELTDVKTLIGLQWLQRWRAGAWPLQWQPA